MTYTKRSAAEIMEQLRLSDINDCKSSPEPDQNGTLAMERIESVTLHNQNVDAKADLKQVEIEIKQKTAELAAIEEKIDRERTASKNVCLTFRAILLMLVVIVLVLACLWFAATLLGVV